MNRKVWLDVGIFGKLYNGAESKFLVCCSQIKSVFGSRWKRSETNSSLEKKSMPQCRGTCGLTRWWLWQIHGCMDGWSRKLLWLLVTRPDTCLVDIASYYLDAVEQYSGCRAWYWFRKRERNNGCWLLFRLSFVMMKILSALFPLCEFSVWKDTGPSIGEIIQRGWSIFFFWSSDSWKSP